MIVQNIYSEDLPMALSEKLEVRLLAQNLDSKFSRLLNTNPVIEKLFWRTNFPISTVHQHFTDNSLHFSSCTTSLLPALPNSSVKPLFSQLQPPLVFACFLPFKDLMPPLRKRYFSSHEELAFSSVERKVSADTKNFESGDEKVFRLR